MQTGHVVTILVGIAILVLLKQWSLYWFTPLAHVLTSRQLDLFHDATSNTTQIETLEKSCIPKLIWDVEKDPCFGTVGWDGKKCSCSPPDLALKRQFNYWLGGKKEPQVLSQKQVQDDLILVFVHVNKAGGQSIKSAMFQAIESQSWNAAGYGTVKGWSKLEALKRDRTTTTNRTSGGKRSRDARVLSPAMMLYPLKSETQVRELSMNSVLEYHCGKAWGMKDSPSQDRKCMFRGIWGGLSLGLCDVFPERPCMYLLNIRNPVDRAVSDYNYFCVMGRENRKKWKAEWKQAGRCPLSLLEYYEQEITSPRFFVERLTRGCDRDCGLAVAKTNLAHPCVRYVLLENFSKDIQALAAVLGHSAYHREFLKLAKTDAKNATPLAPRTVKQIGNNSVMAKLRQMLQEDIDLYEHARHLQTFKHSQPLASCHDAVVKK